MLNNLKNTTQNRNGFILKEIVTTFFPLNVGQRSALYFYPKVMYKLPEIIKKLGPLLLSEFLFFCSFSSEPLSKEYFKHQSVRGTLTEAQACEKFL